MSCIICSTVGKLATTLRLPLYALFALLSLTALALYLGTGREGYTRYATAQSEVAATPVPASDDPFADTGLNENLGKAPPAQANRFAFGLAPSGPGKHSLSLLTVLGFSLVGAGGVWLINRVQAKKTCASGVCASTQSEAASDAS